jgi:hypothetical protein
MTLPITGLPITGLPDGLIVNRQSLLLEGTALPIASPANDNLRIYESIPFLLRNAGTGRRMRMRYREDVNRWINTDSVFNASFGRADVSTDVGDFLTPGFQANTQFNNTGTSLPLPPLGQSLTVLGATLNYANTANPDATWTIQAGISVGGSLIVTGPLNFVTLGVGQSDGVGNNRVWTITSPIILPSIDPIRIRMLAIAGTGLPQLSFPIIRLQLAWTVAA